MEFDPKELVLTLISGMNETRETKIKELNHILCSHALHKDTKECIEREVCSLQKELDTLEEMKVRVEIYI